jgi:S-adenosylmethionine:tRNA ribosyltransferase-isomerase
VEHKGEGGEVTLAFAFHGPVLDQAIAERGDMPLPPYIASRRPPDERDRGDYQTVFARQEGSVAAPTAGLHFTNELLDRVKARGISLHCVTLHVGAGTFLPVKAADTENHRMHPEWGTVSATTADALNTTRAAGGRIIAVGSTALRLLESATAADGRLQPFTGETALFVTPGYSFRAIDALLTNFHLPCSTLFMLVAAFCGLDVMRRAYAHAIATGYRFYSYGDACLLFRAQD